MTATNIFFNFVGFRYSPALRQLLDETKLEINLSNVQSETYTYLLYPSKDDVILFWTFLRMM